MRIDFNVLWIDNQPDNVKSFRDRLGIHLKREGFKLRVNPLISFEEAREHLDESIFIDNVDLVLVDYQLGGNVMSGDEAVRELRQLAPYKDIVFYSANTPDDLKAKILAAGVEGVWCAHREDLWETIKGVFDAQVKKALDIDHCRGIVMGVTSDIDYIVHASLVALEAQVSQENKDKALAYALDQLDKSIKDTTKKRNKLSEAKSLGEVLDQHRIYTAHHKISLLRELIGVHYGADRKEYQDKLLEYRQNVQPQRNKLGHVRLVAEGAKRVLRGEGADEVSEDDLKKFRQVLVDFRDIFDELSAFIEGANLEEDVEETPTEPT